MTRIHDCLCASDVSDGWKPALTNERADRLRPCCTAQSGDFRRSFCGDEGQMAMELSCDYEDRGFNPELESVPIPDPNQDDFCQQDVRRLVNTTFILLQDIGEAI